MKLGEAKEELKRIYLRLDESELYLEQGPLSGIVAVLDECSSLLRTRQSLQKSITETEETTVLNDNTLSDIQSFSLMLESKIKLLKTLANRRDLDEKTKESVFGQLKDYLNSRDDLNTSINRCLCETELIE